ncbi:MAG: biopolymer transporter ExbD [Pirellulaceae bacterium]|nr:biopolymer transporter ExbD [Pirellulaceae bacterium]
MTNEHELNPENGDDDEGTLLSIDDGMGSDVEDVTPPVTMPKRLPMDSEMDITPMIDMTFLLLIFFILTSKMTAEPTYPLPMAKNGSSVAVKNCVVIVVRRGSGDAAVVSRADGTAFADDIEQQSAEIAEYIQRGLDTQKSEVLVRAEGAVQNGEINRIKEVLSEVLEEGQMINFGVLDEP